jgi:hypothetical protein
MDVTDNWKIMKSRNPEFLKVKRVTRQRRSQDIMGQEEGASTTEKDSTLHNTSKKKNL